MLQHSLTYPKTIMAELHIGLIREEKIPQDNRVAFTPLQCQWIMNNYPDVQITVQPSPHRCYKDDEYAAAGIPGGRPLPLQHPAGHQGSAGGQAHPA